MKTKRISVVKVSRAKAKPFTIKAEENATNQPAVVTPASMPSKAASPNKGTVILQNFTSIIVLFFLSGVLSYFLIRDKGEIIQLAGVIKKSSSPEFGAVLISFLLLGLIWFIIELGIEPEMEILGFKSPISAEKIKDAKFVFGLHPGVLAVFLVLSLIGLYLLPADCNVPSILFRISENENLDDEILALPGTVNVRHSGPMLLSVMDVGNYLNRKTVALEEDLECDFEGKLSNNKWVPCYKVLDVGPGQTSMVVTVRKKNCVNITNFPLKINSQ